MKYIYVTSDGDYGALKFERKYAGRLVSELIEEIFDHSEYELGGIVELLLEDKDKDKTTVYLKLFYEKEKIVELVLGAEDEDEDEDEDETIIYVSLLETKTDVDNSFLDFIRTKIQDYDSSKSTNFYFENEKIKE